MSTVRLAHDVNPEQAEGAVLAKLATSSRVDVTLNGFSPFAWSVIAGRLPAGTDVHRVSANHYTLTPAAASTQVQTFYNLATAHERGLPHTQAQAQVDQEIRAQLALGPKVAGYVETIGWRLPRVPGYTLIRDTSRPGRSDVAAYVSKAAKLTRIRWHDLTDTWGKTNPGAAGQHAARSFLSFRADGVKEVVAHLAPPHTGAAGIAAQRQEYAAIARVVNGRLQGARFLHRPAVILGDYNPNATEHGALTLAQMIHGQAANTTRADNVVVRGLVVHGLHYLTHIGGLQMNSDHGSYLRLTLGAGA